MVNKYLSEQLRNIQAKYNFNPSKGSVQVTGQATEVHRAFGKFQFIVELVRKFELDICIPEQNETGNLIEKPLQKQERYLYLTQKDTSNVWKLGWSKQPNVRKKQLQTGNDGTLHSRYKLENGVVIEKYLKRALRKYKTRDRDSSTKGEWFKFSTRFVRALVAFLKERNYDIGDSDIADIKALAKEHM